MESELQAKRSLIFNEWDIQYRLKHKLSRDEASLQRFVWRLLHELLPREARNGGIVKNLKGLSSNNILRNGLAAPPSEEGPGDMLFGVFGRMPAEDEDSDQDKNDQKLPFSYIIKSEFHDFPDKKNIRYKSNLYIDGTIDELLSRPVFKAEEELEIESFFLGIELFRPNFFSYIGFAPRIKKTVLLQSQEDAVTLRLRAEQVKDKAGFFEEFNGLGRSLEVIFKEELDFDIINDYKSKKND